MAHRRCLHTLSRHAAALLSLKNPPPLPLSTPTSLKTITPFQRQFYISSKPGPTRWSHYRHFSSNKNDDDEEDEGEGEGEGEGEDEYTADESSEGEEIDDTVPNLEREYTVEETEAEAAEIGYKVVGPLLKSDRVFKKYEPVFAVVQIGSHQFKVSNGDSIFTERLKFCEVNDKLILNPAPTQKATQKPTSAPTQKATEKPTSAPTQKATQKPTSAPTQKATAAPTQKATQRPTSAPTQKATAAPTQKATQKPTSAPTQKATSAPSTNAPSTGGRICPAGQVWVPAPGTTWQWQITGTVDQSKDVQMYDIDLFSATASVISSLHSKGRVVICYFSTQYEDWRPDANQFPASILGNKLDDWAGERYVDIRSSALREIMKARLDLAVSKGCDGVEPDNVDGYSSSNGFGLTAANQIEYNKFLAAESHKRGLSVGLKNDLSQINQLVNDFDWALNEQCNEYGECDDLKPFINAGKAVFGVEYEGSASSYCPKMEAAQFSWLTKNLDLDASGTKCCEKYGNCAKKAAYTCVSYNSKRSEIEDNQTASVIEEVAEVAEVAEVEQQFDSAASSTIYSAAAIFSLAAVAVLVL